MHECERLTGHLGSYGMVSYEDKSVMLVLDTWVFQVKEFYVTSKLSSREFHSDSIEN